MAYPPNKIFQPMLEDRHPIVNESWQRWLNRVTWEESERIRVSFNRLSLETMIRLYKINH